MTELWTFLVNNREQVVDWTGPTIELAVIPLLVGIALALPLGWLSYRFRWVAAPLLPVARILYTIPSLVMFLVLPGILGTKILDPVNVGVALTLYTLALLVPTAAEAFRSVPSALLSSASAMGQSTSQRLVSVHLPMALPVLGAGIRVAAVSNVALISVASVIGTAQLGQLFITGSNLGILAAIVWGIVFFLALALILDLVIVLATRLATPWTRTVRA